MQWVYVACAVTLVLLRPGSGILWNRPEYDSPEESQYFPVLEAIADNLEAVVFQLIDVLDPGQQDLVLDELSSIRDLSNTSSQGCRQCVLATGAFVTAIKNGLTFEEARPRAIQICYNLSDTAELRGDVICEGAIDIFGPPLVEILNKTTMIAEEICLLMNSCQPDDIEPEAVPKPLPPPPPRALGPKPFRRNVTLDECIKILFITDIHIEPYYSTGAATACGVPFCCRDEWPGTGYAIPWGNYKCNGPFETLEHFLEMFAQHNINYTVYTGDSPSNAVWEETLVHQINMSKVLADRLATYLPGVPAYMALGNHDMYPTNLYFTPNMESQAVNEEFGLTWQELSGFTQEQLDTINTGAFYSVLMRPGLRVLTYNTNFVATSNWYIVWDQENTGYAAMRDFMEETFDQARLNGERIVLLGHHLSGGGGMVREYSDFITDICRRNADLIAVHLFGHSHSDSFRMNTNLTTGEVYDVQYSGPSLQGQTEINPSAKIFYLHPDTFDAVEMDTFYLDLADPINNATVPNIVMSYRGTEEYGMADMTPESFKDLVDRMEVDDALFDQYRYNKDTRTGLEGGCDEDCKARALCEMRTTSYTEYQECRAALGLQGW